jgi:hypothetical protein
MPKEADDMRQIQRAAVTGLFALWLAPLPALAGSQSSNSSSNCSDGRCTQVESFVADDEHGRRGLVRIEQWRESVRARPDQRLRTWPGGVVPRAMPPRRDRDDDADD